MAIDGLLVAAGLRPSGHPARFEQMTKIGLATDIEIEMICRNRARSPISHFESFDIDAWLFENREFERP